VPPQTKLTASLEDYVEAIFNIASRQGAARVTDIAEDLSVAKSSVTGALKTLSSRGLVNYDPYSVITLTEEGHRIAERVVRRHFILAKFLELVLGLPSEAASANACRIEHAVEPKVVERLVKFVDFVELCPRAGEDFRLAFKEFYEGKAVASCLECVRKALEATQRDPARGCATDVQVGAIKQ
jgi:DtxR family Mn-dependent transcriptional regulator